MSSLSISGTSFGSTGAVSGMRPPPPPGGAGGGKGPSPIDSVTDVLGLSADEITSQLQQGHSLDDIAETQGVSHEDLISALKAGMPEGMAQLPRADEMLEEIAAQTGVQGPDAVQGASSISGTQGTQGSGRAHEHHGHGSAARVSGLDGSVSGVLGSSLTSTQQNMLDTLSSMLGSDSESVVDALRSGTDLSDLVQAKGLDSSSLADVIQNGLLVDTTS